MTTCKYCPKPVISGMILCQEHVQEYIDKLRVQPKVEVLYTEHVPALKKNVKIVPNDDNKTSELYVQYRDQTGRVVEQKKPITIKTPRTKVGKLRAKAMKNRRPC